ncbi:MAG TPA: hypothetical protein VH369_24790 [Bryobacteraceae bacterium]|jgi:hypothetical protein
MERCHVQPPQADAVAAGALASYSAPGGAAHEHFDAGRGGRRAAGQALACPAFCVSGAVVSGLPPANKGADMKTSEVAIVAICLLIFSIPVFAAETEHLLPNSEKTPGDRLATVPDDKTASCLSELLGATVSEGDPITLTMICTPSYSKCIRNVSTSTKRKVYEAYGDDAGNHHGFCDVEQGCEVDHLISIEIGGSNDEKNLWPQPYSGQTFNAHVKDRLENWYHANVCSGHVSLKTAQDEISSDWIAAFKKRLGPDPEADAPSQ